MCVSCGALVVRWEWNNAREYTKGIRIKIQLLKRYTWKKRRTEESTEELLRETNTSSLSVWLQALSLKAESHFLEKDAQKTSEWLFFGRLSLLFFFRAQQNKGKEVLFLLSFSVVSWSVPPFLKLSKRTDTLARDKRRHVVWSDDDERAEKTERGERFFVGFGREVRRYLF